MPVQRRVTALDSRTQRLATLRNSTLNTSLPRLLVTAAATPSVLPGQHRIYMYPLPTCSFDSLPPELTDEPTTQWQDLSQLSIHRKIASSPYITKDPTEATLFYIPSPFYLWDNSQYCNSIFTEGQPVFEDTAHHAFDGSLAIPIEVPEFSQKQVFGIGFFNVTISVWLRLQQASFTSSQAFVTLSESLGPTLQLATERGCLRVVVSGQSHSPDSACSRRLDDGEWHHAAVTYNSSLLHVLVDDHLQDIMAWQPSSLASRTQTMTVWYGGSAPGATGLADNFTGEARGLRLYDVALAGNRLTFACGGPQSPEAPCVQKVREYVESHAWIQRKQGLDHFIVWYAWEYPSRFASYQGFSDSDYVIEHAWPLFKNFLVLHLGARGEPCAAKPQPSHGCMHRFHRTVTVPPDLPGEEMECTKMQALLKQFRPVRLAYRGLAIGDMKERFIMSGAIKSELVAFVRTGEMRLEFTNWTHELVKCGVCRPSYVLEGLCGKGQLWKIQAGNCGATRKLDMRARNRQMLRTSQLCMSLPGDGGFELRLYTAINSGCIPVIVYKTGANLPKLPFPGLIPWHKFAIFWELDHDQLEVELPYANSEPAKAWGHAWSRSAQQLYSQLLSVSPGVLRRKQRALLKYGPQLGWTERETCDGRRQKTALDMLVLDLARRVAAVDASGLQGPQISYFKLPILNRTEDLSDTGCPVGYEIPEYHRHDPGLGDVCRSNMAGVGYGCPIHCERTGGRPWCRMRSTGAPCRNNVGRRLEPPRLEPDFRLMGFPVPPAKPNLLMVSFSSNHDLNSLTWPSLRQFCGEHSDTYGLELNVQPMFDSNLIHASWNALAYVQRAIKLHRTYPWDALILIGANVAITDPSQDPLLEAIQTQLFANHDKYVLASMHPLDGVSTSIIAFKRGWETHRIVKRLIGFLKLQRVRRSLKFDSGILRRYFEQYGRESFVVLGPRRLLSHVGHDWRSSSWKVGDFSAQFAEGMNLTSVSKLILHNSSRG